VLGSSYPRVGLGASIYGYRELHNTTEYPLSFVVFQNTNFVVLILDSLIKTGKSGTQLYCVRHCETDKSLLTLIETIMGF